MSGLSCGLELLNSRHRGEGADGKWQKRFRVQIVEARDRFGGRINSSRWSIEGDTGLGSYCFIHGINGNPLIELCNQFDEPIYFEDNEDDYFQIFSSKGEALDTVLSKKLRRKVQDAFFTSAKEFSQSNPSLIKNISIASSDDSLAEKNETEEELTTAKDHQDHYFKNASLHDYLFDPARSPLFNDLIDQDHIPFLRELVNGLESWTGARSDSVSLTWWGFEQDFEGEDVVLPQTYHRLIQKMAQRFESLGGKIHLNNECRSIKLNSETQKVNIEILNNEGQNKKIDSPQPNQQQNQTNQIIINSDACVCTIPLGVLKERANYLFEPSLPPRRLLAISRTGFGLLNKVILRYSVPFWPAKTQWIFLAPIEVDESGSESGSCDTDSSNSENSSEADGADSSNASSVPEIWSPPNVLSSPKINNKLRKFKVFAKGVLVQNYYPITGQAVLVFYFGGDSGEAIETLEDQRVSEIVHQKLIDCIDPSSVPEKPSETIVTRWRSDRFSRGSYCYMKVKDKSNFDTNDTFNDDQGDQENVTKKGRFEESNPIDLAEMAKPLWNGKLGFAGEHCSLDHFACVHGPYLSGKREAERIRSKFLLKK
ncbi:amine oxidase [Phakopsora pachyrhizi]|uniref:Amine oxidase n=1 Tax=Phakopsora pachyrhizi TaxID=170000 RepID=A0AAV0BF20_PHAPC|nr:amine oxidase [Phakopsora pachyrhizi]